MSVCVNIFIFLNVLIHIASGFPINDHLNSIDPVSQWTSWTPILAIGFLIVSIVSLAACICCQRNKGFQEFTDCNSSNSLSNTGGFANSVSPTSEFTIFPPLQASLATPGNRSSVVQFEPLPDIKPPQSQTKRPAAFNSVVNNGLSTHDWFEDPRSNFPRHQLKYVRELGRGWFGRVIEGEAQGIIPGQNSSKVIVKSLHDDATPTDQIYFLHEVKPYRDLNHPNILRLLGRCLETDPFLIIFESCAGGDLKSFLTTNIATANALNEQGTTLRMACDIVSGLEHMIDQGFVHTDLATRNCLVTPDLTVKIGDYGTGIENFKEDYYCTGDIALPIRWCAPETLHCTDTTIETKEVTACANVWSLGVVLWEICEFGKLPYADLTDDEVIIKVLGEGTRRLDMPSMPCSYKHSLYLLMKQCWSPSYQRPELPQVRLMLVHLLSNKQRHMRDGDSLSLNDEDDFEKRWQTFKPNTIPKTDNHIVSDISTSQSLIDESRPPSLFCDSNTNLVHHTSDEGVADLQSLTNYNTDVSNTPHTASPQPSLSSSTGGDFFLSAVQNRHRSPSLQNLRGSVDDLSESADISSSTPIKEEARMDFERTNSETQVQEKEESSVTEQVSEQHDFDSWLKGVETTNEEDAKFVKKISEAIRDLDNALALEKTSSSSESSNDSYMNMSCSPSKNVPDSNQNVVLDFRLGKLESESITERYSEPNFEADSLQDDSFLDLNRKYNQQDVKCTDSGTDTEDEMWRRRIEQGEFSKKVKEKSKSVADLMILTHIECSDGSDSDPPSLTWTFERENILRGSLTKQRCGISLKNSALTSNTGAIFGSDSNIHGAVLGEDFKDTLQKLQAAQKEGKVNSFKEVAPTKTNSCTSNLNTPVKVSLLPSSNEEATNHDRRSDFLENDASEKLQNNSEILVPISVCNHITTTPKSFNFATSEIFVSDLDIKNDKDMRESACDLSKQLNRLCADTVISDNLLKTTENNSTQSETTKSDSAQLKTTVSDSAELKTTEGDFVQLKTTESDSTHLRTTESDSAQLKSTASDSAQLKSTESDSAQLKSTESDFGQLKTTKSDSAQLKSTESDSAQLKSTESDFGQLKTTKSDSAQLKSTESDSAQLKSTENDSTQLETTKSDFAQFKTIESDSTVLKTTESDFTQLKTIESDNTQLKTIENDSVELKTTESDSTHTAESVSAQLKTIESDFAQLKTTESDFVQLKTTVSDSAELKTTESNSAQLKLKYELDKPSNDIENNELGKSEAKYNIETSELGFYEQEKYPLYASTPRYDNKKQPTLFLNHDLSDINTTCLNSADEDVSEITPSCLESGESELMTVTKLPKTDIKDENDMKNVTDDNNYEVLSENFKNCNYFSPAFSSGYFFSSHGKNDINTEDSGPHSVILGPCEDYTLDYFKGLKTTFDDENKMVVNKVDVEYQKSETPKFNEKLKNNQEEKQNNLFEGDFSIDSWNKHLDEVCNERLSEMAFGSISFEHTPSFEESTINLQDDKELSNCNDKLPVEINDISKCDGEVFTNEKLSFPSYSLKTLSDKEIFSSEIDTNESDSLLVPSFKFIAPTPNHSGRNSPDLIKSSMSDDDFQFDDSRNINETLLHGKEINCDINVVPVENTENLESCTPRESVECSTITDTEQIHEDCKTGDNHHTIPIPPAFICVKGKLETCDSSSTEDSAFDFPRSDEVSVSSSSKEPSRHHELSHLDLVESFPEKSESTVSKWQQDQQNMLPESLLRSVLKEDFPIPFNMNESETVGSSDDEYGLDAAKRSTPDDERSSDSGFRDKGSLSESCEDACDEKYNLEDIEAELEETYQRDGFNYDQENGHNRVGSSDVYFDGVYVNARMNGDLHYVDNNADSLEENHISTDNKLPGHCNAENDEKKCMATSSGWFLHPQTSKVNGINSSNESLVNSSEEEQRHKRECKDGDDISSEDSYMSFSLDEEFANAIRNELREKLPYIRQHSKEDEEEETENIDEEIVDLEDDDDKKDDRMDITIQYNSYPTPLSPILEESESMSSSINENYPFFLSNLNVFDSDPTSPIFILKPVENEQDDKCLKTDTNKFEEEIKEALENCSFSSNDTENSSMKEEKKSCIVVEDLEQLSSSPSCDVPKSTVVIVRGTNSSPTEDVLLVDTETNQATLLESPTPKSHLAFICNKKPDVVEESLSLTIDDLDEMMTIGVNSETFEIKGNKFDISNTEGEIVNRCSNPLDFTPDSISPEQRSSETTSCTQSSDSTALTPNTEDLSAVLTSSVPSSQDSLQSDATTDILTKFQLSSYQANSLPHISILDQPIYDPVEKISSNNEAEEIIDELKETGIIKSPEISEASKSETASECDTAEAVSVESPFHSVQNKVSDSSDSFHSLNKDEKKESRDESLTDTSVGSNADNFLVDQDSLEDDSVDCQSEEKSDKEPSFDEKDWSIPSLEASLLSTKAPMPSPEEESWKKIPSMLAFSDLDDVMNRHIQDNHFTEIDDVSPPEGVYRDADDADLMSTSFSTKDDDGEDQDRGDCYTPDWESETEDTNEEDNNSSSSGEFVWKEGEREECIRAMGATSSSPSTYKAYEGLTDFPMEAITEEDEDDDDDDDCSTCSESSTEFVPSAWNSEAIPNRSALRSPDKKSEQKKSVSFKKQKYHCVYEYPRELSDSDSEGQDILAQYNWNLYEPQVDYASYADWELMDGDIPESAVAEVDNDPENTKSPIPEQFDFYKLSNVDYDFSNVLSGENEFYISSSSRPFQYMNGGGPAHTENLQNTSTTADVEDVTVHIVSEPEPVSTVSDSCEKQSPEHRELNFDSEADKSVPLSSSQDSGGLPEDMPSKVPDLPSNTESEVTTPNGVKENTETVINGDMTPPISPTGLGELRHTRDRLKLDLRTKTSSFALDSPVAEKRRAVESVKGEASVLDSGEDTEDSGIESSNGTISGRTLATHLLQCNESVT